MPELPEVQTVVNDLQKRVIKRKIVDFWTDTPKLIKSPNLSIFKREILGMKIMGVRRVGKNIFFDLVSLKNNKYVLLVHQKMTGHFLIGKWELLKKGKIWTVTNKTKGPLDDPYNRFIRVIFFLDNGVMLAFSDLRKFGKIVLGKQELIEKLPEVIGLGPDALSKDFNNKYLSQILKNKNIPIKQMFFDQKLIAGIGNIYADEILIRSKINPLKKCRDINQKEILLIVRNTKNVLKSAIKHRGSSISDFRDTFGKRGGYGIKHIAYGREGKPCKVCEAPIKRIKIGQRSSYFCEKCQK